MSVTKIRALVLTAMISFIIIFSACSVNQNSSRQIDLKQAYRNAVEDAKIAEPGEIYRNLEPIVYYNNSLVWEGKPVESRVLFVTWTSWDGYNDKVGQSIVTTRDIWVTAVPDIVDFCKNNRLSGDKTTLRLEQLLGVPADSGKKWFVEMWVNRDDVFRPSPDPDITDSEAELDFPVWVNAEYKEWFNNLKNTSYGENGYPWTRLGYTYDWGNLKTEVGLSEFIIRSGATFTVRSVSSTIDYTK